ncbi:hypothetical protein K435DRAFT_606668, partial [Dendrothele bispora CBS 962.96]
LEMIRSCIQNIPLPTYVTRPPGNLGEPSHGSLKAYDYQILFTVIFPLIIPELWPPSNCTDYQALFLNNFDHLVASTNIVSAYSTSDQDAEEYMRHYVRYRETLGELFEVKWKPNHHYAMHNPDLLRRWGPLAEVSEFAGERANYLSQSVNTNRRIYDLHHTILQQITRRSSLEAHLEVQTHSDSSTLSEFCRFLMG